MSKPEIIVYQTSGRQHKIIHFPNCTWCLHYISSMHKCKKGGNTDEGRCEMYSQLGCACMRCGTNG